MAKKLDIEVDSVSAAHRIILGELDRIRGSKKWSNTNCTVCCPFHSENTPSCGIYIAPDGSVPLGNYFCFGCGAKGGWNAIADKLNLQPIKARNKSRDRVGYSDWKLDTIRDGLYQNSRSDKIGAMMEAEGFGITIPFQDDKWRSISGDLIRDIGCVLGVDKQGKELTTVLVMPIVVRKQPIALIKAKLVKDKGLSYINTNDSDIKTKGLFPFDHVEKMMSRGEYEWIVLVEGQRDALRLIMYGVPALAILGARSWSEKKQRLLLSLGKNVVIAMDGDEAGRRANKDIKAMLGKQVKVKMLNLSKEAKRLGEKVDPGNMSKFFIKQLQQLNVSSSNLNGRKVKKYR